MVKAYSCTFTTPQGSQTIEAESWNSIVIMVLAWASNVITAQTQPEKKDDLDSVAEAMMNAYDEHYPRSGWPLSQIERAGVAMDVIKCYLQGMSIHETIAWLKEYRGFVIGKTVIGRRWTRYRSLGVAKKGAFSAPNATN